MGNLRKAFAIYTPQTFYDRVRVGTDEGWGQGEGTGRVRGKVRERVRVRVRVRVT